MKTLLLNGSPKGKQGNTEVFLSHFNKGRKQPCEERYIAKEDPVFLAQYLRDFDIVLIAMPLYVHAMPGIVMRLFECMEPVTATKSIAFVVQSGFEEAAQSRFLERYLCAFSKRMGYRYLGTVIRPGSAGTAMMPEKMNEELFLRLGALGAQLEETGAFLAQTVRELGEPYMLPRAKAHNYEIMYRMKLGNLFWYSMLGKNKAWMKRRDRPYF